MERFALNIRSRTPVREGFTPRITSETIAWLAESAAAVICDMWDAHHCISAARRVAELAPRIDEVVAELRKQGTLIIHAPSSCMGFYRQYPGRVAAQAGPDVAAPVELQWNDRDERREPPLPPGMVDTGPCSCDSVEPCCETATPYPWTRQIDSIAVRDEDRISDDGQEVYNLLEQRGIMDVLIMGIHANLCVLGRPFGIRQLVYLGKRPLLCRDLTDSFHRLGVGHSKGTELVIEHIESHWCPTVTSDQFVGGRPFSFEDGGT